MGVKDVFDKLKGKVSHGVDKTTDVAVDGVGKVFGEESKAHKTAESVGESIDETVDKVLGTQDKK